jgi:hypothetical protein
VFQILNLHKLNLLSQHLLLSTLMTLSVEAHQPPLSHLSPNQSLVD